MDDDFLERAKSDFARVLVYWRNIERWIKQAEQVSNEAVVPAINELRYASRQLFNAQRVFDKAILTDGDKSVIRRRLIIAEQYLINADHDIVDSISSYYKKTIRGIEEEVGQTEIILHFPEFPLLKKTLRECDALIVESRGDYDKRIENYNIIRTQKFQQALTYYDALIEAEVKAKTGADKLKKDLLRAKGKADLSWWLGVTGWFIAVIAIIFSVLFWIEPYDDFCAIDYTIIKKLCSIKKPKTDHTSMLKY